MSYSDMMITNDCSLSGCNQEDVVEKIEVMQRQENNTYRRTDYLSCKQKGKDYNKVLDGTWRQRIVEWMFGVVDHCSLRRDSVAVAAYYLDLAVERGVIETRQEFQLAAMTALQLAIKLYDSTIVKLDSMIKLGRGLFTEKDVIAMEAKMLNALKWHVHPPTQICFLRQFLRLLPTSVSPLARYMIAEATRFISEISVCLYKFVPYPSSSVAYAGFLMAMERIDESLLPYWQREQIYSIFSHTVTLDHDSPTILEIIYRLEQSLEKNVSLQDLMDTIDQQCRGAHGYNKAMQNMSGPYNSNAVFSAGMHSPRDVVGRRRS